MFIKSKEAAHPVLLYLHGGMPDYFLTHRYPTGLEDDFTVVWWEQRGSGMSYSAGIPPETMMLEQMISDTLELRLPASTLRERKDYLMDIPEELSLAYVACSPRAVLRLHWRGADVDQLKSEKLVYDYMLEQFRERKYKHGTN
jgi:hypothetical protein